VCAQQLSPGFFSFLDAVLAGDFRSELVQSSVEVVWNLLQYSPSAALSLAAENPINLLTRVLTNTLTHGHRLYDKHLRNDLLVVRMYLWMCVLYYVSMSVCMSVCMYVCMYLLYVLYVCMYECMRVCLDFILHRTA